MQWFASKFLNWDRFQKSIVNVNNHKVKICNNFTFPSSPVTICQSPFTFYLSPFTYHFSFFTFTFHLSPFTFDLSPFSLILLYWDIAKWWSKYYTIWSRKNTWRESLYKKEKCPVSLQSIVHKKIYYILPPILLSMGVPQHRKNYLS